MQTPTRMIVINDWWMEQHKNTQDYIHIMDYVFFFYF